MNKKADLKDIEKILSTRYDNGADYWSTPDGRIGVGGPFSTIESLLILSELEMDRDHEAVSGAAGKVMDSIQDDGRVRVAPKGTPFPCHSAAAAAALCRNGYGDNPRVRLLLSYLMGNRYEDGGWRCRKFSGGRGPETEHSNPGVTLWALDAFRCSGLDRFEAGLDEAVETLLEHWRIRKPIGPCHFGIGSQFMKVEYPFLRYNIFYYTYVLSFYEKARKDERFAEALDVLKTKLDHEGSLVVERPNRKLADYDFCRKGNPSPKATKRFREIIRNMEK